MAVLLCYNAAAVAVVVVVVAAVVVVAVGVAAAVVVVVVAVGVDEDEICVHVDEIQCCFALSLESKSAKKKLFRCSTNLLLIVWVC